MHTIPIRISDLSDILTILLITFNGSQLRTSTLELHLSINKSYYITTMSDTMRAVGM